MTKQDEEIHLKDVADLLTGVLKRIVEFLKNIKNRTYELLTTIVDYLLKTMRRDETKIALTSVICILTISTLLGVTLESGINLLSYFTILLITILYFVSRKTMRKSRVHLWIIAIILVAVITLILYVI